ncbi:MAG: superoxide dismutase [Candidatus Woesebacteria bacterium]|nr:MAG: superoxide dismutase [Candidatus Woesebacteria bacterium]
MHVLPNLPYDYGALEPYIDTQTMELHHNKHHQAYIDNLNKALEKYPDLASKKIENLLLSDLPEDIKQAVVNNGGGHFNHSFFWEIMSPKPENPKGPFLEALNSTFGSLEKFKDAFTQKAMSIFGSGWAWLLVTPKKKLILKRHSFQNPPIVNGNKPILGLDVWEHAYYLKYQNKRADYIKAWWNVVNWPKVQKNFNLASK